MRGYRKFTAADGLTVEDLLRSGSDHLSAAEHLVRSSTSYYDSAGYLFHIGFELLIKAWLLHVRHEFDGKHKLLDLWADVQIVSPSVSLSADSIATMNRLDEFEELRYPNRARPVEIGSDDLEQILSFETELGDQMPDAMLDIMSLLDPLAKGGRLLMKKRK